MRQNASGDVLVDYDSTWAKKFAREKWLLQEVLGEFIVTIHHVGSTAVPGLIARPVIDIAIGSLVYPPSEVVIAVLRSLDYIQDYKDDEFGYRFHKRGEQSFCLYWYAVESKGIIQQLHFRDRLRSNPDMVRQYDNLKRSLAAKHPYEERLYNDLKIAAIAAMMQCGYGEENE